MAHVLRFHRNPDDLIGMIARPEVAQEMGLPPSDARALYPVVIACMVVGEFRKAEIPLALIELEGPEHFRKLVRGEFSGSNLEDWEIQEAYAICLQYLRDPSKGLHFKFATPEKMRLLGAVVKDMRGAQ